MGKVFFAKDREAWRSWLKEYHASAKEVRLLVYKKKTGKECVSYDAAVEEALCFGWIDGRLNRIDDKKHVIRFSPRKARSIWAESNKVRVRKMIRVGRMTEAGLAVIRAAKKSGQWGKGTELDKAAQTVPADLKKALAGNKKAQENFRRFPPSSRTMYVGWVIGAKQEETRKRRIRKVVLRSAANRKPGT